MSVHELTPAQALGRALDSVLNDIQALVVWRAQLPMATVHDLLPPLFCRLAAASCFLTDRCSAERCLALAGDWGAAQKQTGDGCDRQLLRTLLQCRQSLSAVTAGDLLRQVLVENIRVVIADMTITPTGPELEPVRVQQAVRRCVAITHAAAFVDDVMSGHLQPLPQTPQAMLRWLLALELRLMPDVTDSGVPEVFRRELERCVLRCCNAAPGDGQAQSLWQLQLLAGALLALSPTRRYAASWRRVQCHCQGLLACAAQALYQRRNTDRIDDDLLRRVIRHTWLLLTDDGWQHNADNTTPSVATALVALPDPTLPPVQEVLGIVLHKPGVQEPGVQEPGAHEPGAPVDWANVGLRLYRLLVCLQMLDGGFVGSADTQYPDLSQWQNLIGSLYASVNHCVQLSVVTGEDKNSLTGLLRRLQRLLLAGTNTAATDILPAAWLLAARLGLRTQNHWQRLTLELDAVQQDFAGSPVHRVLAAELHCLPGLGATGVESGAGAGIGPLPRAVLRDLRVLLKGARILNVQRIESLVVVMIEVYQQILASPAFAESADIGKVLPRAHRSLCRMLDQAAAWQPPGNARRVINSLYVCLERWRGDIRAGNIRSFAAVNERPAGHENDTWRLCLATNRRLRKLLRHQDDLDSIRALLLELLRSQEESIRRQANYGATLDAPPG